MRGGEEGRGVRGRMRRLLGMRARRKRRRRLPHLLLLLFTQRMRHRLASETRGQLPQRQNGTAMGWCQQCERWAESLTLRSSSSMGGSDED